MGLTQQRYLNGHAEQPACITANQDGLLARDLNGHVVIHNASELFESATIDGFNIKMKERIVEPMQ